MQSLHDDWRKKRGGPRVRGSDRLVSTLGSDFHLATRHLHVLTNLNRCL